MPPRKREKEIETKKDQKPDHDLFIQAYEKPTQIYKFLRARFKHSPYFLYRNITYVSKRTRRRSCRHCRVKVDDETEQCRVFKAQQHRVDSIGLRLLSQKRESSLPSTKFEFLTIKYLGFYNKDGSTEPVKVDTLLMKVSNKKRKANNCPVETKQFDPVLVPCNPAEDSGKFSKITIPTENLNLTNGQSVKSYNLLILVSSPGPNGVVKDADLNGPSSKKRKLANGKEEKTELHYGTNLTVYDKLNRCLLPDGEYQLLMHELNQQNSPKITHVNTSWETLPDLEENESSPVFKNYAAGPNLKLCLFWTNDKDSDSPSIPSTNGVHDGEIKLNHSGNNKENNPQNVIVKATSSPPKEESNLQIVYQFLYSNNSRQQTEPLRDFHCPWCPKLDCLNLYSLLKHLKLCHARFTFAYTEIPNGARIDVALNDKYDGSYIGTSRDIAHGSMGFGYKKRGPIRRASVSKILVCHPKRPRVSSLSEFLNEKDDIDGVDGQRAYISGHNRLYHHTTTCLPIYPKEMDIDSEDESDPKWLQKKTTMMIDDFTDVNDGEKELMKMWNLHVMKHGFVGDCQIPLACNMFLEARGQELLKKNLYRNFVLHMCNLFDFGLISPVTVYTTIQRLQELIGEGTEISTILRESWSLQRINWLKNVEDTKPILNGNVKSESR